MTPSSGRSPARRMILTMTIPDVLPGAGQWRYVRELQSSRSSGSLRDDTSLTKRRLRSPLKDPELLDSIVKDIADQRKAETSPSTVSRHRDAALCPLAQTAGFRSDATSDRADRLYIVNSDEVMCRAESVR